MKQAYCPTRLLALCIFCALLCSATAMAQGPVPGQNINMVSGITFPGGDPFLQRQNEPSLAVSTRNPLHLLAGSNDYRSVNLNADSLPGQTVAGDAWVGVFRSRDGGATWRSTLLPGFPQDGSPQGLASPLHGFTTAADPTVRASTNGLFYYSGIAFNRGTNLGVVFVARFMDLDNVENADSIQYISTKGVDSGTSGQFLDKPWIAVGLPTGGTCTIQVPQGGGTVPQTIPAAPVYLLWSRFTGTGGTKIMFSRSLDCGATWSTPTKLSESNSLNQGTTIAVGPTGSTVLVAWRRFATPSAPDAIVAAVSTNAGKTFSKAIDVVALQPFNSNNPNGPSFFDQVTSTNCSKCFRTRAFPALAIDGSGRAYLVWSQRGFATGGQARIAMSTSPDGLTWSAPAFPFDNGPLNDRGDPVLDTSGMTLTTGHQFMPSMTFTGGKLTVAYYDQREDHTVGLFFLDQPGGLFYNEKRDAKGELLSGLGAVFTPFLTDDGLTIRRHTIDVVVAQANPAASPVFTTARVSQYKFGLPEPDILQDLQQLQVNPPNLPMFAQGTTPFIGDYIDVAGLAFLSPGVTGTTWQFNTSGVKSPVHYVTWTDNRDVQAPSDGDWTIYTPPLSAFTPQGATCDPGHVGDRNQNIYVSRVTQGLFVFSPQNSKPLSLSLQRAFVVIVQNLTNFNKFFRLSIANQPVGGFASFTPGTNNPPNPPTPPSPLTITLDVAVPAHSGAARAVFATSSNPTAAITVNADEITGLVAGSLVSSGLSSFVVLNPDSTAPALAGGDIGVVEKYGADMSNPTFTDGSLSNGSLSNIDPSNGFSGSLSNGSLANGSLSNGSLSNGSLANGSLSNGSLANVDLSSGSLSNGSLANGSLANGSLSNGSLANGSLANTSISDASYTLTNNGDTTASYTVKLVGNTPTTDQNVQLIATTNYLTPFGVGCDLLQQPQTIVLDNILQPPVDSVSSGSLSNGSLSNGSLSNLTLAIPPGDSVTLTIRGVGVTLGQLQQMVQEMVPAGVPHAPDTDDPTNTPKFAAALFITTPTLANGIVGAPYTDTLQSIGGTAPLSWSITFGNLPAGLTLDALTGVISGTPTAAGTFTFTVGLADSSTPEKKTTSRVVSVTINRADTTTTITSALPNPSLVGQPIPVTWGVTPNPPSTAGPALTGTVTVTDGLGASCTADVTAGSCTLTPAATMPKTFTLTATYSGDSNYNGSSGTLQHSVVFLTFTGFLSPLAPAGTFDSPTFSGTGKLGNAQPIKWQLQDTTGNFISDLSTTVLLQAIFNTSPLCSGAPTGSSFVLFNPTNGATGGSTFRFDTTNNQFIFNWDTTSVLSTGPGCYTIVLQLSDNSPLKATTIKLQ